MKHTNHTYLKQTVLLIVLFLTSHAGVSSAKELTTTTTDSVKYQRLLRIQQERDVCHLPTWSFHVGTDIGGSVPEFKYIPKVFTASPQFHISIGTRLEQPLTKHWSLTEGIEYKQIGMDAGAYVENMHAFVPQDGGGKPLSQYFTGSAVMEEKFSMFEFPIYLTYKINGEDAHSRILFGGYFAYIYSSRFNTVPTKGYIGDYPDFVDDGYNIQERDEAVAMDFASVLSKWDAGITLGYEYEVFARCRIGLRASLGFKDIFNKDCFPNDPELAKCLEFRLTHMRAGLYLSYDIFSKRGWWANRKNKNS